MASPAPKPTNGRLQGWGSIPLVSTKPLGRQVGRRWSAKPTIRGFDSHPGVQLLQRSLMAKPQAHNLVIVGSSPIAATKHRWCNGNITVSKTVVQGSNPCLCVLRCALIREAYILVTRLNSEVGSTPTASANLEAEKQLLKLARCRKLKPWCRRQIGKAVDLSSRCLRVQLPSALPTG